MKSVLFAWELGRGLGHLIAIRHLAARLSIHGIRTIAAINHQSSALALQDCCEETIAAPAWPFAAASPARRAASSSATLNDILSTAGLSDADAVRRMLTQWSEIFRRFQPNLVIADFAPMAALAARGRIPLALVGNGYTLPPDEMPRFPPLHRRSPPRASEERTLEAVNHAASALGLTKLETLPQLFSADARFVQAFDLLDPYHTQRIEILDGPLVERQASPRREDSDLIFVYLSVGYAVPEGLVSALRPLAARVRIHAPRLTAPQCAELARSGAQIDCAPVALADILPSCRLIVHRGGSGVASEALLAGVPQLILSGQIEQYLNGEALEHAGVGRLIEAYDGAATIGANDIAGFSDDATVASRAADLAARFREDLARRDPALRCQTGCLALLER